MTRTPGAILERLPGSEFPSIDTVVCVLSLYDSAIGTAAGGLFGDLWKAM